MGISYVKTTVKLETVTSICEHGGVRMCNGFAKERKNRMQKMDTAWHFFPCNPRAPSMQVSVCLCFCSIDGLHFFSVQFCENIFCCLLNCSVYSYTSHTLVHTFTSIGNVVFLINLFPLTTCLLTVGGSLSTHANTGWTCKLHIERPQPDVEIELRAWEKKKKPLGAGSYRSHFKKDTGHN